MQARFIGTSDPTDSDECTVFDLTFARDEWVEVPDDVAARLTGNATFELNAKPKAPAPPAVPAAPAPAVGDGA